MDKKIILGSLLGVLAVASFALYSTTPATESVLAEPDTELLPAVPRIENTVENDDVANGSAVGAKIHVRTACESALAYTDFVDAESAENFVLDCIEGKHPEVIERYIESLGLEEGMAI